MTNGMEQAKRIGNSRPLTGPQLAIRRAFWKAYLQTRARQVWQFVLKLKNRPCTDCGDWLNSWQMDFDHVRGQKKFNVSQPGSRAIKTVLQEIAKCELVCANCHRNRTFARERARYVG